MAESDAKSANVEEADPAAELQHVRDALAECFGITATEVELLDAGSTPNHKVTAADGKQYLCKALRTRLGDWVADNASQITVLASHLSEHGVPTPKPVPAADGVFVAVREGPRSDEKTYFVVFEWAVGYTRADKYLGPSPNDDTALLMELGKILAKIHELPIELPGGVELSHADAKGGHCLCDLGTWLEFANDPAAWFKGNDDKDAVFFRSWLATFDELFKNMSGPRKLIHGDCYLDNVLAKSGAEGISLLVVDFEDSCLAHPVADIAACAVGTCFVLSLDEESADVKCELIRSRVAALVKGYETHRKLSEDERPLLLPLMQACAWACGAFRYGRFLEGVSDVKTRKYGQLIEIVDILEGLKGEFNAMAFES